MLTLNSLLASEFVVSADWIAWIVVLFGAITGALAFYIRATIRGATISINQLNGGSHLADLPSRVDDIEAKLDRAMSDVTEAKVTGQIVLKNQLEIMAVIVPHYRRS